MSYVIVTYLPLYAKQTLGISEADAFFVLFVAVLLRMALIPIFGLLSDRMGRRKMLAVSMGVFAVTINPTT